MLPSMQGTESSLRCQAGNDSHSHVSGGGKSYVYQYNFLLQILFSFYAFVFEALLHFFRIPLPVPRVMYPL